jgi:hypothetical protein
MIDDPRSFPVCASSDARCAQERRQDPQGWCRHVHAAWEMASTPSFEEWIENQVGSAAVHAAIGREEDIPS